MKDNKLEVGDVLYESNRWHGLVKHVITRLTPTTALAGETRKYKIELITGYQGLSGNIIGQYGSDRLETDDLKAEYKLQQLRVYAHRLKDKFNVMTLNEKQLNEFITFAKPLSELVKI